MTGLHMQKHTHLINTNARPGAHNVIIPFSIDIMGVWKWTAHAQRCDTGDRIFTNGIWCFICCFVYSMRLLMASVMAPCKLTIQLIDWCGISKWEWAGNFSNLSQMQICCAPLQARPENTENGVVDSIISLIRGELAFYPIARWPRYVLWCMQIMFHHWLWAHRFLLHRLLKFNHIIIYSLANRNGSLAFVVFPGTPNLLARVSPPLVKTSRLFSIHYKHLFFCCHRCRSTLVVCAYFIQ